jgi:hypothetical protein
LTPEDSGTNGYNVIYTAYPEETPVLSGGRVITGWQLYDPTLNLYRAPVPNGLESRQLFVNGVRAIRARSEAFPKGFVKTASGYTTTNSEIQNWGNLKSVELVYYEDWTNSRCPIEAATATEIKMQQPCFGYGQLLQQIALNKPAWIENALELLDEAGEWYLDSTGGFLYYRPRVGEDLATAETVVPVLESLVVGQGEEGRPVHNIHFSGLQFSDTTWLGANAPHGFVEVQANYPIGADRPTAAINYEFAQDILFDGNRFCRLGGAGVYIGQGSQHTVINANQFHDISGVGVEVGGITEFDRRRVDLPTFDNLVANNRLWQIGIDYQGAPAVVVGYTEQSLILHNEIWDVPYTGISVGWGWGRDDPSPNNPLPSTARANVIAYNHIYDFMKVLIDGGGIYTLGSQPESLIAGNYIHDQHNIHAAIYLDEGTQFFTVTGNVIGDSPQWLLIWTQSIRNNIIQGNYTDQPAFTSAGVDNVLSDNIVVQDNGWPRQAEAIIDAGGPGRPSDAVDADYQTINLGQGRSAWASSVSQLTTPPDSGNDGDEDTVWASRAHEAQSWWAVDLGAACWLGAVELVADGTDPDPAVRRNFVIQADNDPRFGAPTTLGKQGKATYAGVWRQVIDADRPYRYIRILKTANEPLAFSELRVWQSRSNGYCNVAVAQPVTASSIWNGKFAGPAANDNRSDTGWSPAANHGQPWWQVDLGAAYHLIAVELLARQDLDQPQTRSNFEIWGSNDCDFTTHIRFGGQESNLFPDRGTWIANFNQPEAFRYVRVIKTIPQYFFIAELRVWAKALSPLEVDYADSCQSVR